MGRKKKQWRPFICGDQEWEYMCDLWERLTLNEEVAALAHQAGMFPSLLSITAEDFALACLKMTNHPTLAHNLFNFVLALLYKLETLTDNPEPLPVYRKKKRLHHKKWGRNWDIYRYHMYLGYSYKRCEREFGIPYSSIERIIGDHYEYIYRREWKTKGVRKQDRSEIKPETVPCFRDGERWVGYCPYKTNPYKEGIPQCEPDCFEDCLYICGSRDCGGSACGDTRPCRRCTKFYQTTLCQEAKDFTFQDWKNLLGYQGMPSLDAAEVELGRRLSTGGRQRRQLIGAYKIGEEEAKKVLQGAYNLEYKGVFRPTGVRERRPGHNDAMEWQYRAVEEQISWRKKHELPTMPDEYIADCEIRLRELQEHGTTIYCPPFLSNMYLPRHTIPIKHFLGGKRIFPCWECNGQGCQVGGILCEKVWNWVNRIKPSKQKGYIKETSPYRNLVSDFNKIIGSKDYELFLAAAVDKRGLPRLNYFDSGEPAPYLRTHWGYGTAGGQPTLRGIPVRHEGRIICNGVEYGPWIPDRGLFSLNYQNKTPLNENYISRGTRAFLCPVE